MPSVILDHRVQTFMRECDQLASVLSANQESVQARVVDAQVTIFRLQAANHFETITRLGEGFGKNFHLNAHRADPNGHCRAAQRMSEFLPQ